MTTKSDRTSWSRPVKLDNALAGEPPPEPTVGTWTDTSGGKSRARALFYPNEVHSIGGEPESMKSWLALLAGVQEIKLGHHVLFVDMEANDRSIVYRLKFLGATNAEIKKWFHYYRPDDQITEDDQRRFRWIVSHWRPSLVVLDGVTEAFALHGLSINASEDSAAWFRAFARRFQIKRAVNGYDGPAIVELDHVVKDRDGRGLWTIGTQHKKAGIKGAMYMVEVRQPFGSGKHGVSRLWLAKDSQGGVDYESIGSRGGRRRYVADLHCDASGGGTGVDAWIETADVNEARDPDADRPLTETYDFRLLMQEVGAFIEKSPGSSLRLIRDSVTGTNEHIKTAVEVLCRDGFLENQGTASRGRYVSVKEFKALRVVPAGGGE